LWLLPCGRIAQGDDQQDQHEEHGQHHSEDDVYEVEDPPGHVSEPEQRHTLICGVA